MCVCVCVCVPRTPYRVSHWTPSSHGVSQTYVSSVVVRLRTRPGCMIVACARIGCSAPGIMLLSKDMLWFMDRFCSSRCIAPDITVLCANVYSGLAHLHSYLKVAPARLPRSSFLQWWRFRRLRSALGSRCQTPTRSRSQSARAPAWFTLLYASRN